MPWQGRCVPFAAERRWRRLGPPCRSSGRAVDKAAGLQPSWAARAIAAGVAPKLP